MAKSFDFNNVKKQNMIVTLADENKTKLLVGLPTKEVFERLVDLETNFDESNVEVIENLYEIVSDILNCNKNKIHISKDMVKETMDYEDIIYFIRAYGEFIQEIVNSKN